MCFSMFDQTYIRGKLLQWESQIRIFKIRNSFCCIPKGSLKDNIKDHYMVGFGIRNKSSSEENKRFPLFVVQETHRKGGVVTPKINTLNMNRCVCLHTHQSLRLQMPRPGCISELRATKVLKQIQPDSSV